ncbi:MAG: hypothetical protein U0795_05780 [Pirellulales bacterium]
MAFRSPPTSLSQLSAHSEPRRPAKRILIVDRSDDGREVLAIGLFRQGLTTLSTSNPEEAQRVLQELEPDLVLVDADTADDSLRRFPDAHRTDRPRHEARWLVVSKPYHYRPLIRKIVEMLDDEHSTPVDRL